MITKFIENTNNQYSIREDGVVIRHYHKSKWNTITYKDKFITPVRSYCFNIHNKKGNTFSHRSIMFKYFTVLCKTKECKNAILSLKHKYCIHCGEIQLTTVIKQRNDAETKNLTKTYVSNQLGIKTKNMPDSLYYHHRNTILFKRQLAKTHNVSINSLK